MREMRYFSTTAFNFDNRHVKALISSQSDQDKQLFNFDMSQINWDNYLMESIRGIKKYILLESDDPTVGQKRHQK